MECLSASIGADNEGRRLQIRGVTLHSFRYAWAERAKVARYLILYRPLEKQGLEIVRLLHGTRDLAALLENLSKQTIKSSV